MASRAEEKEQRRRERLAAEQQAAAGAKRLRIVQLAVGGILAAAIVVAVVIAATGGDDGAATTGGGGGSAVAIPAATDNAKPDNLAAAAQAAGCEVGEFESEGREHSSEPFADYETNPPTSGTHNPVPADDGIYDPGNAPAPENWVHTLEHGRIILQYKPGTPERVRSQLETLFNEDVQGRSGYHMVLLENNTEMDAQVAAVSWTRSITCDEINDRTWDALRAFRDRFVDKAPELIQ
jgi:hypothetical protein